MFVYYIERGLVSEKWTVQRCSSIMREIHESSSREEWIIYCRIVRRLVTLISRLAQVQADCEAAQRQAESASAAARQFMEDKENKVIEQLAQRLIADVELRTFLFHCVTYSDQKIRQTQCSTKPTNVQGDHLSGKPGKLTAVREMSGILLKIREMSEKILSGKSCLKLFIVNCIFVSIQVFSRSLFCLKC